MYGNGDGGVNGSNFAGMDGDEDKISSPRSSI